MLKRQVVKPPDRGSFPLDHFRECTNEHITYLRCLEANKKNAGSCRIESGKYLVCRMKHNLLAEEPLEELGYRPDEISKIMDPNYKYNHNPMVTVDEKNGFKEDNGYLAGVELIDNYSKARSWLYKTIFKFKS
ncbi:Cytochrome c oxidase assembly protein COX19 [Babesia microti strain RI]|uniref:Cytochrome c oxidase assembly protein COX19 n=1 Tax=Babesia microti (strain RI) TaxID=1133968 RepID=A0A0K3ATI8_BABMR|nr:Cytochrome c oxidase assembly protein COX19 [Babesia microti strain RI]CTQ40886.1 Cytochrome c oxidase assembly protein COX19 [Babesia microti strain RI]|eukprot:XP_012648897.1 Cytochrome c oxidase assembly protein COX19 [Babesia microti strain RI]